jgi:hypothetical protein
MGANKVFRGTAKGKLRGVGSRPELASGGFAVAE